MRVDEGSPESKFKFAQVVEAPLERPPVERLLSLGQVSEKGAIEEHPKGLHKVEVSDFS